MDMAMSLLVTVFFCILSPAVLLCANGSGDLEVLINVTYTKPLGFTEDHPNYRAGSVVTLTCFVDGIQGQGLLYKWTSTCKGDCLAGKNDSQSITLSGLSSTHSGNYTCSVLEGDACTGNATTEVNVLGIGVFIQSSNVALANNSLIIANRRGGIPNFACFSGSTASGVGQLIDCNGLDISRKSGDLFVVQYGSAGEFEVRVNGTFNMSYEGVYSCRMTDHLGQIMDFNFGIYTQGRPSPVEEIDQTEVGGIANLTGPETKSRLKIGVRVRRGPDWTWGDQDGPAPSEGTVIRDVGGSGWVTVRWDSGSVNGYRMGYGNQYDLSLAPSELTKENSTREKPADTDVTIAPTVMVSLEKSDSISPLRLTCTSTGAPPPLIIWSKDGLEIDVASNRSKYTEQKVLLNRKSAEYQTSLIISDIGDRLIGKYSCSVPMGTQSNLVEVTPMEITGYEKPIIVGFGGKLVCSTQLQVTALHWFLDGIDIPLETTAEQELVFTLNPDDITLNGAIFICEVRTDSNVYRRNVSITVKEMEHKVITTAGNSSTAYAGETYTLTCTVIADFPHNTTWLGLNGIPLSNDSLSGVVVGKPSIDGITTRITLTFTTVTTSQAGQYNCYSVMNVPASTAFSVQDLFVTIPPPILIVMRSPSDEQLHISTQLNVTCTVLISAAVDTMWTGSDSWSGPRGQLRSGVNVSRSHGSSSSYRSMIQIDSLQYSDSGTYGCSVAILDGTGSRFILGSARTSENVIIVAALKVSIGVDYTGDALQPSNYRPGSSLRLTCRVEGNTGYLRYRWTTTCTSSRCFVRNWYTGSSVSDNILSYVDAGNHTCTVTDGEGNTGTSTATVNIEGVGGYHQSSKYGTSAPMANNSIIVSKTCSTYGTRFSFYCCSNTASINAQMIGRAGTNVINNYGARVLGSSTSSSYPGCVQFRSYYSSSYYRCRSSNYFTSSMQGVYTCRMTDSNLRQHDFSMGIYSSEFSSAPVVTSLYHVTSRSVFTLNCISTNSAATSVTWTRNGIPLSIDGMKYKLIQTVTSRSESTYSNELQINLCDTPEHLGGSYTCNVSNIFGSSSRTVHFDGLEIHGYSSVMTAGEQRNFSCSTDLVVSRLEWVNKTDNNTLVATTIGNRLDLHIPVLSSHHNGAELACRVVSNCGIGERTITLNVTIPNTWGDISILEMTDPLETSMLSIPCLVRSIPNLEAVPQVMWLDASGQEITNSTHTNIVVGNPVVSGNIVTRKLIFSYLNTSQGGIYTCNASLSIPGLNSVPPLLDAYYLVVTSQSLIQLRFGPVENCILWTAEKALTIANSIRKTLADNINKKCGCNFQVDAISTGDFSCQSTGSDTVYRTVLNGTSDTVEASAAVKAISEWIDEDGTFVSDLRRLYVRSGCPLHITSLAENECGINEGGNTGSSTTEGCLEKCMQSILQSLQ